MNGTYQSCPEVGRGLFVSYFQSHFIFPIRMEHTRPALRFARVMRASEAKRRVRRGIFVTNKEDKLKVGGF